MCSGLALAALSLLSAAAYASDTTHLQSTLKRIRGWQAVPARDRKLVQAEFVTWIDTRVAAGRTASEISRELKQAKLSKATGGFDFDASLAGLVDIGEQMVRGANDVFALTAQIGVGGSCAMDYTVILYDRQSRRRVAWISADPSFKYPYYPTGIATNNARAGETRLIATGWSITSCVGNWNGKAIRIDRIEPGGQLTSILRKDLTAFSGNRREVVAPWVELDDVTFLFDQGSLLTHQLVSKAIEKYRIEQGRAVRQAPLGLSIVGFIDAWLALPEAEVPQWGSPQATRAHKPIAGTGFARADFLDVGKCGDSVWELAVTFSKDDGGKSGDTIFRVEGTRAKELRMASVSAARGRDCKPFPVSQSTHWLDKELPW